MTRPLALIVTLNEKGLKKIKGIKKIRAVPVIFFSPKTP